MGVQAFTETSGCGVLLDSPQKSPLSFSEEDLQLIERDIENLKENGYAITYGEYIKGLCGIAAPIFDTGNKVEMSIELIGFTSQFEKEDLHVKGKLMKEVADEISRRIRNF